MAELDEGLGYLNAFITDLGEKQNDLGGIDSRIDEWQATMDALVKSLEEARNRVAQVTEERQQALESAMEEAEAAVNSLVEEGNETLQKLGEVIIQTLEERQQQVTDKADECVDRVTNGVQTLVAEGFEIADQTVETVVGKMTELKDRAETIYDDLGTKIGDLQNSASDTVNTTIGAITEAAEHVGGDLSSLAETTFGNFSQVSDSLMGDEGLFGAFTNLTDSAESGFTQVGDFMSGLGDQLVEQVEGVVSDTISVIEEEVFNRLQEEFEKVVVNAVQELIGDFAESIVMMSAGSAITGAISPYVPALAGAKAAVTAINDLLDALNPFD